MDKHSTYLLQKIDCNCNNCIFMDRDQKKFNFCKNVSKKAGYPQRINYGNCTKFNKPVSFIPGLCQLHTQGCFKHRNDGEPVIDTINWKEKVGDIFLYSPMPSIIPRAQVVLLGAYEDQKIYRAEVSRDLTGHRNPFYVWATTLKNINYNE